MKVPVIRLVYIFMLSAVAGCASIQAPTGGARDKTPPKLLSVSPPDSQLNVRTTKIEMRFDEYVTLTDVTKEVQISPILKIQPVVIAANKKVTIKLTDSLLENNTTYRISFGSAIRDLHEGNVFSKYTYSFSTGGYFDSLSISGKVLNGATGLPDSGAFLILYSASKSDSAIVREKPQYITAVGGDGSFSLKGLPAKKFRIYALADLNGNLIYDGGEERIGFFDDIITPGDSSTKSLTIRTFKEIDTSRAVTDSNKTNKLDFNKPRIATAKDGFTYAVPIDTSNHRMRTVEITRPIVVTFNKKVASIAVNRMSLGYDSAGSLVPVAFSAAIDTVKNANVVITTAWKENTLYTLKLLKGFAKDTGNIDANPSKYIFLTKRDEDYGKILLHIPTKYTGRKFLLMVQNDKDTIYSKPVLDSTVSLINLKPGNYIFRIIADNNENGKWDPGILFKKVQPEVVIPYRNSILLKAGWDNIIDFEEKKKPGLSKKSSDFQSK